MSPDVDPQQNAVFKRRRTGVLLHPTSLPGAATSGKLGHDAFRFVDFLQQSGCSVWQVLPLGPTLGDLSPYMSHSVHAGNPQLISLEALSRNTWLSVEFRHQLGDASRSHQELLAIARQGFMQNGSAEEQKALREFRKKHHFWLEDYALYQVLRQQFDRQSWVFWPAPLRDRDPEALKAARHAYAEALEEIRFEQFVFFSQWQEIRAYANERDIRLFGDMPIFVAHDSAEVWAHRECFNLEADGEALTVAGVPPDYFSETGQRWGNPHYRWERMAKDGYRWWIDRLHTGFELYDVIRIDHFRGFEAYWEIAASEPTARQGQWVAGPGEALFDALAQAFPDLPLVAEDLGIITPAVEQLRDKYHFPGMKILQFAFDGTAQNPYLPEHHVRNCVVYTGTHDNDTTLGWYLQLDETTRQYIRHKLGISGAIDAPWDFIRAALASPAQLAIIPMQDLLGLGSAARMNTPGVTGNNWQWRFDWTQVAPDLAGRLAELNRRYQRSVTSGECSRL